MTSKALEKLQETGGFTLNLETGKFVTEGFAVSVNPESTRIVPGMVDTITLAQYGNDHRGAWREGKVFGAWLDTETGLTYFDVVTIVDSREEALALARSHGEIAVFDIAGAREIRIEYREGDPDPTPGGYCPVTHGGFWCTWNENHNAPHVAGTGLEIVAVWEKA